MNSWMHAFALAGCGRKPIKEQCETSSRFIASLDCIGATTANGATNTLCIKRETKPALIFEPMPFGWIEGNARFVTNSLSNFF